MSKKFIEALLKRLFIVKQMQSNIPTRDCAVKYKLWLEVSLKDREGIMYI